MKSNLFKKLGTSGKSTHPFIIFFFAFFLFWRVTGIIGTCTGEVTRLVRLWGIIGISAGGGSGITGVSTVEATRSVRLWGITGIIGISLGG